MSQLSTQISDGIAIVRFGNPPKGLMNQQTIDELRNLGGALAKDESIGAVVFTGELENVFIRHYDVAELAAAGEAIRKVPFSRQAGQYFPERPVDVAFQMIENLPQLTIAAINGYCMGGGYEFALCCDIRIAKEGDYMIGLPECRGGIFPGAGGTQRLPRVIGVSRALDMILRGRLLPPAEALKMGLVHEVISGDVMEYAISIAQTAANGPIGPNGVQTAKRLIRQSLDWSLPEGIAHERSAIAELLADPKVSSFLATAAKDELDILKMP